MTIDEAFRLAVMELRRFRVNSAQVQAENILIHVLEWSRGTGLTSEMETARRLRELIASREEIDPETDFLDGALFCGLRFKCTKQAFIPRGDTEVLADLVDSELRQSPSGLLYDVGTGNGALAIALSTRMPDWRFVGTDINVEALDLAAGNALKHAPGGHLEWRAQDLLSGVTTRCDAVVAVLPYGRHANYDVDVHQAEPADSVDGGTDGLDLIHRLIPQAAGLSDRIFLEVGPLHQEPVAAHLHSVGFAVVKTVKDFLGAERYLIASRS
jgi:release factor glutamine methyltransferase